MFLRYGRPHGDQSGALEKRRKGKMRAPAASRRAPGPSTGRVDIATRRGPSRSPWAKAPNTLPVRGGATISSGCRQGSLPAGPDGSGLSYRLPGALFFLRAPHAVALRSSWLPGAPIWSIVSSAVRCAVGWSPIRNSPSQCAVGLPDSEVPTIASANALSMSMCPVKIGDTRVSRHCGRSIAVASHKICCLPPMRASAVWGKHCNS